MSKGPAKKGKPKATACAWCNEPHNRKQSRFCSYECFLEDRFEDCLEQAKAADPATAKERAGQMFLQQTAGTA